MRTVPGAGLTRRTLVAAAATSLLIGLVFVQLVAATRSLERASSRAGHSARVLTMSYRAEQALVDLDTAQRALVYQHDATRLAAWQAARAAVPVRMRALRSLVADNPPQEFHARMLSVQLAMYVYAWSSPLVSNALRDPKAALALSRTSRGRASLRRLRTSFASFVRVEQALGDRRSAAARRAATRAMWTGLAGLLAVLGLLAAFAFYVVRTIVRPVRDVAGATARAAAGDLSVRVPTGGAGEVGDLGRAFNTMSAELERERDALRELTDRLAGSNRDLEDFASIASHDLQEPLRKIRTFADRLARRHADGLDAQGLDYLERMQRSAARMQELIDDLLTLSRVSTSGRPFGPVDLTEVGEEVVADLEASIEGASAAVELGPLPTLDADRLQMRQLLQNLIANAIKFRRPGVTPEVRVFTGPNGDGRCRLVVEDNGIGFDPRYAEQIFTVFERLNPASEYEGSGVGLAVCRRIAERHGGEIAASAASGEGARFVVTLPLRREPPAA